MLADYSDTQSDNLSLLVKQPPGLRKAAGDCLWEKLGFFFISLINKKQTNKQTNMIETSWLLHACRFFSFRSKMRFLFYRLIELLWVFFYLGEKWTPVVWRGGGGCGKTALSSIICQGLGFYSQKVPDKVKTHAAC